MAKAIRASAVSGDGMLDPTKIKDFEEIYKTDEEKITQMSKESEAKKRAQLKVTAESDNKKFISDVSLIGGDVGDLLTTYDSIPDNLIGPLEGRTTGYYESIAQNDPSVASYLETKQFFLSSIARTLGAERGVLTDTDIKRVDGLFPRLENSKEVGINKMIQIKKFISRRIKEKGTPEAYEKFQLSFMPGIEDRVDVNGKLKIPEIGRGGNVDATPFLGGKELSELSDEELMNVLGKLSEGGA